MKRIHWLMVVAAAPLAISLGMSFMRLMGHDALSSTKTKCAPLYIDKLEPVLSTRWFCEQ